MSCLFSGATQSVQARVLRLLARCGTGRWQLGVIMSIFHARGAVYGTDYLLKYRATELPYGSRLRVWYQNSVKTEL